MARMRTVVAGIALVALVTTGCEWHFEVLDGNGGSNGQIVGDVGEYNAAVIYNDRPHVFYRDNNSGNLRHAYYNGVAWAFETLDGNGGPDGRVNANVGFYNAAVIYNSRPHVFYHDGSDETLRHAYYNGVAWAFETLDGNGGPNGRVNATVGHDATTILYNSRPHVFYQDTANGDLRHGYYNGVAWAFETLDGSGGPNGRVNANVGLYNAALVYGDRPRVFYYDVQNHTMRHAYFTGGAWGFEVLDGNGGINGRINAAVGAFSSAILYNGRPHIFYNDGTNFDQRHAYFTGTAWGFETLDGAGGPNGRTTRQVGWYNAAVLHNGRPRVFQYDTTNGELRQSYWNGQFWAFEALDGAGGPNGRTTNVVGLHSDPVVYNGRPDVFYYDYTDDTLRHGWFG